MLTLGLALFGASGSYGSINHLGVSKCIGRLRSNKDPAAYLTLLALGRACLGAGSGNRGDHFFVVIRAKIRLANVANKILIFIGVSGCGNLRLRHKNLFANRAMLTLGLSRLGTSRSYSLVNRLGVSESINRLLSHKHRFTYRAMLTLGLSRLGTGRSYSLVNRLGVSECRYILLSLNDLAAIRALNTRRNTLFGAGGSLLLADCLGLGMTASRGLGHVSSLGFRALIRLTVAFGGLRGSLVRAFGSFFRRGLVRAFGYLGLTIIRNVIRGVRLFSYV